MTNDPPSSPVEAAESVSRSPNRRATPEQIAQCATLVEQRILSTMFVSPDQDAHLKAPFEVDERRTLITTVQRWSLIPRVYRLELALMQREEAGMLGDRVEFFRIQRDELSVAARKQVTSFEQGPDGRARQRSTRWKPLSTQDARDLEEALSRIDQPTKPPEDELATR